MSVEEEERKRREKGKKPRIPRYRGIKIETGREDLEGKRWRGEREREREGEREREKVVVNGPSVGYS